MRVDRRKFLQTSGLASASMFLPQFLKAQENDQPLNSDKILVIIQLTGGNDGLNTVIPFENDLYFQARPKLAIQKPEVLKLNTELGLNPNLPGFKKLFDDGQLSLVNNVGYPDPDRSHFRSMDIWQTASHSNEYLNTGWIGRLLDEKCKDCERPTYGLEIDDSLSLAMKGEQTKGLALKDPKRLYGTTADPFFSALNHLHQAEHEHSQAGYLYKTLAETISSADYIYQNSRVFKSNKTYPDHELGKQLKTIAELIISGIDTRVYYVSHGSFDTHVNQTEKQGRLLKQLSESVTVFLDDLQQNGRARDVLLMTFSEFGRRLEENASAGTDHGTASQVFIIGKALKTPGIFNEGPNLGDLDAGDLKYTVDFRRIYATLLEKWLQADSQKILNSVYKSLDII
jgi:uncharacterized protein (DUF1501 family)